jgi:hypothetical protein
LTGLELAVGSRRIGKRITLSRPRTESSGAAFVDRTELLVPVLLEADPDDFLTGKVRVTVESDAVDSVVVASVSTVAASVVVEEAFAVSASDRSERAQPAASKPAAKAPASETRVIDRFPE